jgi:hypothetical protein
MILSKFYSLVHRELQQILENNPTDEKLAAHKDSKNNKGYALLVWFLKFYGQNDLYTRHITDGSGDSSCDIIFSKDNFEKEKIYYVIQSKNINLGINEAGELIKPDSKKTIVTQATYPQISKDEFGATLTDFAIILSGQRKPSHNISFNEKYKELVEHLERNGKVKFIFFTLAKDNEEETPAAVAAFNKDYAPNVSLEIIDVERIRRDYIEFKYKEITTSNPLEYNYSSEEREIVLPIERLNKNNRDVFEFEGSYKAYTFLLKPATLHALFKEYKFSLFFKNVRNPIHRSNYNQKIIDTLLEKPNAFWYFNNGITAITSILPDVGIHAKQVKLDGLQIINGAQTVYSVYSAYENANISQRKAMDAYAKISLRLIGSSDKEFNLQVTRFTNFQNPMENRDFWANDAVQQRIQNESFATDIWYEKRRDEFQLTEQQQAELGIRVIKNTDLLANYVAFHLQKPAYNLRQADFFVSRKEAHTGLYEEIFIDNNIQFSDIYAAYQLSRYVRKAFDYINQYEPIYWYDDRSYANHWFEGFEYTPIALFKIVAQKYFAQKNPNNEDKTINISNIVIKAAKSADAEKIAVLQTIMSYSVKLIVRFTLGLGIGKRLEDFKTNIAEYSHFARQVEESDLDISEIDKIGINY